MKRGIFLNTKKSGNVVKKRTKRKKLSEKESVKKSGVVAKVINFRRYEIGGIFFCLIALIAALGIFDINAGYVGKKLALALSYIFGVGALPFATMMFLSGLYFITEHKNFTINAKFFGAVLLFLMFLTSYHYVKIPAGAEIMPEQIGIGGGLLGGGMLFVLKKFFGETGSGVVIFAGLVASVLLITNWSLGKGLLNTKGAAEKGIGAGIFALLSFKRRINEKQKEHIKGEEKPLMAAHLFNQEEEPAEKIEFNEKTTEPITEEPLARGIEPEERKPKLHSFWQDLEKEEAMRKNAESNTVEDARIEDREEIEKIEETTDCAPPQTEETARKEETDEILTQTEEEGEEPQKGEEQPLTVPPAERADSGMDAGGFAIRSDAFVSREIPPFPQSQTEETTFTDDEGKELDLSEPNFYDYEKQDDNIEPAPTTANENLTTDNFATVVEDAPKPLDEKTNENENVNANANVNVNLQSESNLSEAREFENFEKPYELPEVTHILSKRVKKENLALKIEIEDNARTLSKTLADFKVNANIINACHGPAVTRYELEPAPGVKVSKITGLAEDIALALAATSVRIEPIPNKSAIGVEVPNKELEGVQLREVLEEPYFSEAKSKLTVGLGKDIGGQAIFADLAKMPHLLIAGSTGSGKSVCVNTLITSILFKAKPDEVKFILIDPKMVELSNYNGIPHLMVPVVTDAKKAASVLNWAVQEMEKRYSKFAEKVVRNMETYNAKFPEDKMGAIVIIIDELADLMMVAPHDVEDAICRLAQKARAAGIHLVLATQRPSVDVITGIIKANIPSRIAFAVSSQIDSRTILDSSGAEKLLGKGDMLFYPMGSRKPLRVQGAFVSDEEVEMLLDFIKGQGVETEINEEIETFTEQDTLSDDKDKSKKDDDMKVDELLTDAIELVMSTGQASASNIQRRFRVGYARAGRIIDTMETLGIVGPSSGSKPREILMSEEEALTAVESLQE